jgi:hypothetical protein
MSFEIRWILIFVGIATPGDEPAGAQGRAAVCRNLRG